MGEPPSPSELAAMLEAAREATRIAGQELLRHLGQPQTVTSKGLRDIVTEADLISERLILEHIRTRFPSHRILSEESWPNLQEWGEETCWAVDPLDGTSNYARGGPLFSISVAALRGGRPLVGAVHEPIRGQTFSASLGGGAFLNGLPLRVSKVQRPLSAMVAFDWGRAQRDRLKVLALIQRIGPKVGTLRAWGSAALGLCYVAAGWTDAYFHVALNLWDVAAGVLLVREAGGRVTQWDGRPWNAQAKSVLASNGWLHEILTAHLGD
ncbi:MAG: inositol monophosphatase family protein [Anaerolineae bacterium]